MKERKYSPSSPLLTSQKLRLSDTMRAIRRYGDIVGLLEELNNFPNDIRNDFGICALVATTALFGPESIHLSKAANIKHFAEFAATVDRVVTDKGWEVIKPKSSHEFTALLSGDVQGALVITATKKPEVGHAICVLPLWGISEEETDEGMQFCAKREFFIFDTTSKSDIDLTGSWEYLVDLYTQALVIGGKSERAVFVFKDSVLEDGDF